MDSKLRGFGAVCRLKSNNDNNAEYRLLTGRGIKNIHIWSVIPDIDKGGLIWTCTHHMPTNGNTIETLALRKGGFEVLSKSKEMNIRVWDLTVSQTSQDITQTSSSPSVVAMATSNTASPASPKPTYEDIPNTQDIKVILGPYAYGGLYEFAVVRLEAPKTSNRDTYEVPVRGIDDEFGQRKKRYLS